MVLLVELANSEMPLSVLAREFWPPDKSQYSLILSNLLGSQIARLNQARSSQGQAKYQTPSLPDWQAVMEQYGLTIHCMICEELVAEEKRRLKLDAIRQNRHKQG
ncbi:protein of unknown function, might belong to Transposase, IS91 family (ISVsa10 like) [Shewanella benthica]|uniref:Uncharacterized protein n=1 Tax=Shewanella benthica TaxID=43661 RepID=A0A330LVY4_9GAMM|nr:protein of unknown function, might belong to Transposase, IS91 family (ISVsa10 like) [Shewanella benthica]